MSLKNGTLWNMQRSAFRAGQKARTVYGSVFDSEFRNFHNDVELAAFFAPNPIIWDEVSEEQYATIRAEFMRGNELGE